MYHGLGFVYVLTGWTETEKSLWDAFKQQNQSKLYLIKSSLTLLFIHNAPIQCNIRLPKPQ